jgi:uncharacterized membrane protein YraQ (UPF0718 family)
LIDFLLQIAWETWYILKEAALFLLLGFSIAGILAVLVPGHTLLRFFGRGKVKSVLWASTLGIPLPLCSCGVLPTAIGLRRQGATKGATVSFLISTPETGIDSISLSYALMDPLITVFRPLAAMITAISAGLATNFFGESRKSTAAAGEKPWRKPRRSGDGLVLGGRKRFRAALECSVASQRACLRVGAAHVGPTLGGVGAPRGCRGRP